MKPLNGVPYRPSIKQMERFEQKWCKTCAHLGFCSANEKAAIGIVPPEWLWMNGKPICSSYKQSESQLNHGPIANHILEYLQNNAPCTQDEIKDSFGYKHSQGSIERHLQTLEREGIVIYQPNQRLFYLAAEEVA